MITLARGIITRGRHVEVLTLPTVHLRGLFPVLVGVAIPLVGVVTLPIMAGEDKVQEGGMVREEGVIGADRLRKIHRLLKGKVYYVYVQHNLSNLGCLGPGSVLIGE